MDRRTNVLARTGNLTRSHYMILDQPCVVRQGILGEAAKGDVQGAGPACLDRDLGGPLRREPIHPGADAREGDGFDAGLLSGEAKGFGIAGCQQFILVAPATVPDRADGMDNVLGRQPVPLGDLGLARLAPTLQAALIQQFPPGRVVDGPIDPAAA